MIPGASPEPASQVLRGRPSCRGPCVLLGRLHPSPCGLPVRARLRPTPGSSGRPHSRRAYPPLACWEPRCPHPWPLRWVVITTCSDSHLPHGVWPDQFKIEGLLHSVSCAERTLRCAVSPSVRVPGALVEHAGGTQWKHPLGESSWLTSSVGGLPCRAATTAPGPPPRPLLSPSRIYVGRRLAASSTF